MIAFEVIVNGERICIAGHDGQGARDGRGWTSVTVSRLGGRTVHKLMLDVTGHDLGAGNLYCWDTPAIAVGDEITIKVIEADHPTPRPREKAEWTPPA